LADMKARVFCILTGMIPGLCFAQEAPVGISTVPPSSLRSGLVRSPNPMGSSGNLIVTGNVTGGKHFRGLVPYRSSYDFRGRLGSSDFDSFLRRSAGSEDYNYIGKSRAYYSRSRTGSSMTPGGSFIRSRSRKVNDRVSDKIKSPTVGRLKSEEAGPLSSFTQQNYSGQFEIGKESFISSPRAARYYQNAKKEKQKPAVWNRGLSSTSGLLLDDRISEKTEAAARFDAQAGRAVFEAGDLRQLSAAKEHIYLTEQIERDAGLEPGSMTSRRLRRQSSRQEFAGQLDEADTTNIRQQGSPPENQAGQGGITDPYSQSELLGQELKLGKSGSDKSAGSDFSFPAGQAKAAQSGNQKVYNDGAVFPGTPYGGSEQQGRQKPRADWGESKLGSDELSNLKGKDLAFTETPDEVVKQRARALLDSYPDFESFCRDKYSKHIRAARQCLREGRYYSAANWYTLASAYKAQNSVVYTGKAHALFAAGEYMSSSLFLKRALEKLAEGKAGAGEGLNKKIIKFASNLLMVARDTLESRAAELESLQKSSGSWELEFLLCYVYYQMGREEAAQSRINSLSRKMPEEKAVTFLKKVINSCR